MNTIEKILKNKLNVNHIQSIIAKNFKKLAKESIDSGKDANGVDFIQPKAGNKPVYKSGILYNGIEARYNKIYLEGYAKILQNGGKYRPRKFMPMSDTKLFERLIKLSKEEIFK